MPKPKARRTALHLPPRTSPPGSGRPDGQSGGKQISDLQPVGRVMALDVGERRIGVAVSDTTRTLATPHTVIERRSKAEDFVAVARLVAELEIKRVVVGLPLSLNGEIGPQARRVTRYAQALAQTLDVPMEFHDERYSTATADALLADSGRKRRVPIDAAAAAVILQAYLESQGGEVRV